MRYPPGPSSFWEIIKLLIKRQVDPIGFYESMFEKYGDMVFIHAGKHNFLLLNNADAIEQVLQTDAKYYKKSTAYERFRLIFGNGLLTSEGELWKKQRRMMAGAFTVKNIEKLYPLIIQETEKMTSHWKDNDILDLAEEMNGLTLQIISRTMLGELREEEKKILRTSVQEMLKYLQTSRHLWLQLFLLLFPIKDRIAFSIKLESKLPFKSTRVFFKSIESINHLVHRLIETRRLQGLNENLLDLLIRMTDFDDGSGMNNLQLRDEVVNVLIAGHETTSNALSWTFHQLLKYPDIMKKVTSEVRATIQGESPTYDEIEKLSYTKAVFQESMRLYPPFWRISRQAQEPTKIQGYDIPIGTDVIAAIYTVQRSPKYWHAPLEFRPDRFLAEIDHHKFSYIPFGAGPRVCIGIHLAMIEAISILATCLKKYDLHPAFSSDPTPLLSLTMQPKEGCKVKIKKVLV